MASKLTSRGRALRWLTNHRGITESPPGSNCDDRKDGIRAAQLKLANGAGYLLHAPWCGVWHAMALIAGGVKGVNSRQASVFYIEDDARAKRAPYGRGWISTATKDWYKKALRGDGVVLFKRGEHVETLRSTAWIWRKLGLIRTEGGNTTSGATGDQANGGGSYARFRRIKDVHGFALVDYPNA
jgi:hypothetical protein